MKKLILGIFLIVLITFNAQTSFGYSVTFEDWGNRIKEIPLVCILTPTHENNKYLTEPFVERLMTETQLAIDEWEGRLKLTERSKDKSMWEINHIIIPFEEQKEFEYDKCYIFIHFKDKPELEKDWYKLLGETKYEEGDTGRSDITIYYAEIKFCFTEDERFYFYDPCYQESHRLMQQLKNLIKHEFGHALGLGHYVADNMEVNIAWAQGQVRAPSIMVVFSHQNFNENIITLKDIEKVASVYGEGGFLQNKTIEENTFQSFESSLQEYIIPYGGFQTASMDGVIDSEKFISGVPVIVEITSPDGTSVFTSIQVNSNGIFKMQKIIDSSVANGTYFAVASYRGEKSNEITFDIVTDGTTIEQSKIPEWIKNSVRWWSEDKIENLDFVLGIQHLIKMGILNPFPNQNHSIETKTADNEEIIDSDGDGIPDKLDSCIYEPEIFNGILDLDGCPEIEGINMGAVIDTDNDGIPDYKDQCPKQKEIYNKIQDSDGCPETNANELSEDSDFDKIEDKKDDCPTRAEGYNRNLDNGSCPDVILEAEKFIVIPEWVKQNAKWWVNGEITDESFTSGIQYLIEKGIMKISVQK